MSVRNIFNTKVNWVLGGGVDTYTDGLWIYMTPILYSRQYTLSRRGKSIVDDRKVNDTFTFLAPVSINFAVNHLHEKYDSIASRAADVYSRYMRVNKEVSGLAGHVAAEIGEGTIFQGLGAALSSAAKNIIGKGWAGAPEVQRQAGIGMLDKLAAGEVAYTRVDAPLIYKDTDNIRYAFEFELAAYKDCYNEITNPIQKLISYSCPEADDDLASVKPPYVFRIEAKSKKGGTPLIKVNYAALRTVSPTYHQPFINGHPSKANLVLEFVDIEPVYRKTFDTSYEGRVTVTEVRKLTPAQRRAGETDLNDYGDAATRTPGHR
jgi:hypothetical protein